MRSALVVLAIGAALLVVAVASGLAWSGRHAPEWVRLRIEASLAESLEAPVRLPSLRLGVRGGLRLVASEAELGPNALGLEVRAARVAAWLDPLALFTGRLRLDRIEAEAAEIGLPSSGAVGIQGLSEWLSTLEALRSGPVREIRIASARLDEIGPDGTRTPLLAELHGSARRGRFRPLLDFALDAKLPDAGAVSLELRLEERDLDLVGELTRVDLARLAAPIRRLLPAGHPVGRVSGTATLERRGTRHTLDLDLRGDGIAGRVPGGRPGPEGAFALGRPHLEARIVLDPDSLRVVRARLQDGAIPLHLSGRVGLPFVPEAPVRAELRFDPLSADDLRGLLRRIPSPVLGAAELLERVEACTIEGLTLALDSTRTGLEEMLARDLLARPGEFHMAGAVRDARVAVHGPGRPPRILEEIEGRLRYDGEELIVEGLHARLEEHDLPRLHARIGGLSNLRSFDEIRCVSPGSAPTVRGVRRLFGWLRSFRKEPRPPPSWQRLDIEADWLAHPALLCEADRLLGHLRPIRGGLDFEIERAIWAGLSLSGSGRALLEDEREVSLDLEVAASQEPQDLVPHTNPWGQGRFDWNATRIGGWRVAGAAGRFRLSGTRLLLEEASLDLEPGGSLTGAAELDLADAETLRLAVDLRGDDLDVTEFIGSFRAKDPGRITGRLSGTARFEGPLVDKRSPLATSEGELVIEARDGWIARELPVAAALVLAESPFEPIRGLDKIPFDRFELSARLEGAVLDSPEFQLTGSTLRVAGAGRVGVERPFETEAVLGLLLFPQIDSLIGRVPVLNRVILGAHGNLIGAYYSIAGPWQEPRARLVPVRSLVSSGPASFMLEDLPSFLWGGIKRIHAILLPGSGQQDPTPAPPSPPHHPTTPHSDLRDLRDLRSQLEGAERRGAEALADS